jgi:hypothetical protein
MGIKETFAVLNAMQRDGVIGPYAIAGAVAAYNYIEPTLTEDLDILVAFDASHSGALVSLAPLFADLRKRGYTEHRKEGLVIEGWQVQFLPIANELDAEALREAQDINVAVEGEAPVIVRCLKPEHLVAQALRVGRPKDFVRIAQFLEEATVDLPTLCSVLDRHGLRGAWQSYCGRVGLKDPCA